MFDVGWSEMLVIAVVLIVVVGPKDLPRMLRQFGRTTAKLRAMAGDFRRQFDEALKEAELDDVSETLSSVRKINPMNEIRKHLAPIENVGQQVRAGLDDVMKPQPKPLASETSSEPVAAEPLKSGPAEMSGEAAPAVEAATPKRAARAKTTAAKSTAAAGAPKAPAKAAAVKPKATVASAKASPKQSPSKAPAADAVAAPAPKASKAGAASARRTPAKAAPAGRKKTESAR